MIARVGPFERVVAVRFGSRKISILRRLVHFRLSQVFESVGELSIDYSMGFGNALRRWTLGAGTWQEIGLLYGDAADSAQLRHTYQVSSGVAAGSIEIINLPQHALHEGSLYRFESTSDGIFATPGNTAPEPGQRSVYWDYPLVTHHPALNPAVAAWPLTGLNAVDLADVDPVGLEPWISTTMTKISIAGELPPLMNFLAETHRGQSRVDAGTTFAAMGTIEYRDGTPEAGGAIIPAIWGAPPNPYIPAAGDPPPTFQAATEGLSPFPTWGLVTDPADSEFARLSLLTEIPDQ